MSAGTDRHRVIRLGGTDSAPTTTPTLGSIPTKETPLTTTTKRPAIKPPLASPPTTPADTVQLPSCWRDVVDALAAGIDRRRPVVVVGCWLYYDHARTIVVSL
ncbi:MAG: hypothetical protein EBY80_12500, partial [Actinobacteria bacterium]|nr:hypothetical protein [Actinomycetota bacterium]